MRLLICFVLSLAISPSASAGVAPAAGRSLALLDLEDAARYLFGAARDSQWQEADEQVMTLQHAFMDLPADAGPNDVVSAVRGRVQELVEAVPHRDRGKTMEAANELTQLLFARNVRRLAGQ